ncbi:MAG TPA: glucose-6-phosphate dehydrogenase [Gammaproteobacteria bacterium]|uniref:glucose-6-phosphate dehydrogenase n=1 Tax=Immundisolibacter sp. TaxID=1934948 RepID=UPI000E89B15D|nr:glucose-6-phosphate dehydrogenase [Gammaproteobacteria bacterium]HCZ48819.1 glucose-6-phosphate dehydrogenase [Gammaproteobacteria bacterium]MCH78257.1 glucose-6-phosphate dehydrogenase [Gammaproteobacteria bacterium]
MSVLSNFDLIFFGATGDLALRKLLPALYFAYRDGKQPAGWRILGLARRDLTRDDYLSLLGDACRHHIPAADFDDKAWNAFCEHVDYLSVDGTDPAGFAALKDWFAQSGERVRVFYLSTAARLFGPICEGLAQHGLVTPQTRVVLEKPLGHDCASAEAINEAVGSIFAERQIFRIDHYLGKETVQNLLALRFGNSIFEPLWNRGSVRDVQITISEQVGVEERGEYYDPSGALRDMVQSHMLQLLCILAMEPPTNIDADAVRDEKLKVLRALRPITAANIKEKTVRGQYRAGAVAGKPVPGYLEEADIPPDSQTETYVAIKAEIDNWRWSGVPFFLRTGKRLPERMAEIVVNFRQVPHAILPPSTNSAEPNRLVIRLQPDEGVKLFLLVKVPGEGMRVKPVALDLDFAETFKHRQWEAYERLLREVIQGNLTLFMRRDELAAAWRWVDPILEGWRAMDEPPKPYTAGTWGPAAASALILRDGLAWREET